MCVGRVGRHRGRGGQDQWQWITQRPGSVVGYSVGRGRQDQWRGLGGQDWWWRIMLGAERPELEVGHAEAGIGSGGVCGGAGKAG